MKKKLNLIKIIKGVLFIALAISLLTITFADYDFYLHLIKETPHNYIMSGIFFLLGILELKEGVFNGD
ncbi:hypothetical protein [Methanoculleus sp.]|uniref:hypothetical protein n=1 Tax=Methanoculleus sp. TaxID=90427 RepID=UPI0025ED66C5|nr:hypothetical protein [Methanoculleus sp.]MCK9319490.1 hypothetical protein [Methanoculleus sp.]